MEIWIRLTVDHSSVAAFTFCDDMKTVFGHLEPFYFWQERPFTQWTRDEGQFTYEEWLPALDPPGETITHTFSSTEQWMMWKKARLFDDIESADLIMTTNDCREVKALGRKVKNFKQEIWDRLKLKIVYDGNMLKFTQNPEWADQLKQKVLDGWYFVEASPYDKVWGIGINPNDARNGKAWNGENLLGIALTNVALDLIKKDQNKLYTEDVNYVSIPVTEKLQEALEEQGINTDLLVNIDTIENEFSELVTAFVEKHFGRGEYRHHH